MGGLLLASGAQAIKIYHSFTIRRNQVDRSNPIRRFGLDQLSMVIPCRCTAMAMTLAYVAASRRSRLLAYLGSMLLSETKVTQQSHQEVWFGSAEHGSVRLQRRWSWLQLIKYASVCGSIKTFTFVGISWLHVAFRDQSHPAISSGGMVWIS